VTSQHRHSIDVAHCRYNLIHERADAAEVFTREWERHTGRTFHRWADIAVIIGLLAQCESGCTRT